MVVCEERHTQGQQASRLVICACTGGRAYLFLRLQQRSVFAPLRTTRVPRRSFFGRFTYEFDVTACRVHDFPNMHLGETPFALPGLLVTFGISDCRSAHMCFWRHVVIGRCTKHVCASQLQLALKDQASNMPPTKRRKTTPPRDGGLARFCLPAANLPAPIADQTPSTVRRCASSPILI